MSVLQRLFACIRRKQAATLPDTPNISENKIRKVEYCSEECGIAVNFVCQGTAGEAGNVFKKYCSKIWGMHPLANETTDDQRHYIWLGESEGSSHSRIICDLVQQKGVLRVGLQDAGLDFYHRTPATEGKSSCDSLHEQDHQRSQWCISGDGYACIVLKIYWWYEPINLLLLVNVLTLCRAHTRTSRLSKLHLF